MGIKSFYYWLSDDPPILHHAAPFEETGEVLPEARIYRLPMYLWHYSADDLERYHARALARRPRHVLHHLINERDVCLDLQARGIPAAFVNHNAFVDERIFTVRAGIERRYDAVYSARMVPFKRHALARDIPELLILGGVQDRSDSGAYFDAVRGQLPRAHFTHGDDPRRWLSPEEVAATLNRARVGLCLSSCEGAMYSASEYLLCGLPVVSTASVGGRDEWFDAGYARVVRDDPRAIAEAVRELIARDLSPHWIRQQVLRKVWGHRRRFVEVVQRIYDREQVGRDFAREWYGKFFNKMGHWRDLDEVMKYRPEDCPGPR